MPLFVNATQPAILKEAEAGFNVRKAFPLLQTPLFNKLIGNALPAAHPVFEKLNSLARRHGQYEYTSAPGVACRLEDIFAEIESSVYKERKIDRYPLPDVWREFYEAEIRDFPAMLQLLFVSATHWGEGRSYKLYEFMNKEFLPEIKRFYGFDLNALKKALSKLPYINLVNAVIRLLADEYWDEEYARRMSSNVLAAFLPLTDKGGARKEFMHETYAGKERRTVFLHQHSAIRFWMSDVFGDKLTEATFAEYFGQRYAFYHKSDYLTPRPPAAITKNTLSVFDFGHACQTGLISEAEMRAELDARANAGDSLHIASSFRYGTIKPWQRNRLKAYGAAGFTLLEGITAQVSDSILESELSRGEGVTELSHLALRLGRIEGAPLWIRILGALGSETFVRIDHTYSSNYTRREVLSHLCRICHPSSEDTPETLARLAKRAGAGSERLVEAALYAPQWLALVEGATGWKGLQNIACFFHAHINDHCSEAMKAEIARFTPAVQEDLSMGAFETSWFRRACREIGSRRYEKVFAALKRITSGAAYARISQYIAAYGGKMDAPEVRRQIEEKRSRDLLMMYGLIPLNRRSHADLIDRYRYFLQFFHEGKAYGSQRHESEKKAVELGLSNLARTAGYTDITRLVWNVGTLTLKSISPYFNAQERSGVKALMRVDGSGMPVVHYFRQGKELLDIPSRLRKDPYVAKLRTACKSLRAAYANSGIMLERAMEERTPFPVTELKALKKNPFVWPILKMLLFVDSEGTAVGFYDGEGLVTTAGDVLPLSDATALRLAHPVDLHALGVAEACRTYLRESATEQAFEQAFRKHYPKSDEEQACEYTLRHAGEQLRPGKAAAILKARRWIAVDEELWQKAYPADNVMAAIETVSHALSPQDTGPSTMKRTAFFDSKSNAPLQVSDVPDDVFSEVMRDVETLFA
ncbi:MAG: DUF4132 domain-containing protein [Tannerellaceae bacterium]|jgi:DNA-binding transcriptional ArsR family regulator|nr:DUF4132 domain-containing protein [Tannerellaceae bacterium]